MSTSSPRKKIKKIPSSSQLDKIQRQNIIDQQRRIKPGECHKYIRAIIDPEFISGAPGSKVTSILANMNIKYHIQNQKTPRIVTWERLEQQFLTSDEDKVSLSDKYHEEKHILLLMFAEELIEAINAGTLPTVIEDLLSNYEDSVVTLLIFGLKSFSKTNSSSVNRNKIEKSLTELQIMYNCSHRLQESSDDLAQTVAQFSKAVAEIPFKKQQTEKFEDACIFLANDNKDCVRVEGSVGLSRLWQQHLTRLPHVTLGTAEAIMAEFPKPKTLLEVYEKEVDGSRALENLKIRRAGQHPLVSARRIGPELSKKVYTLYTSLNPDETL